MFDQTSRNQGTLVWKVPFVGPGSASQSPYNLEIVAFDGKAATRLTIPVEVVNVNRSPQISIGSDLSGQAGDELFVPFAGTDPDFDAVSFAVDGLPSQVEVNQGNPGFIRWNSAIQDSGDYDFTLTAIDENGGTTTQHLTLQLLPSAPVELGVSDAQAYPGEFVDLYINMHNRVPVAAFNLSVLIDKSVLTPLGVDTVGTRLQGWSNFNFSQNADGTIFINASSDDNVPATNPLAEGDGPVVHLRFLLTSSTQFAGLYSRVDFAFADPLDETENAAYAPDGTLIPRSQIQYSSGGVLIKKYDGLIGDINLNGIAFEIGDLVYFTNYFVSPSQYPLDGERWQNSDINQNGQPGELADLIMMIQIINGSSGKLATGLEKPSADYAWKESQESYSLRFSKPAAFAAALITFEQAQPGEMSFSLADHEGQFELHAGQNGNEARALVISRQGRLAQVSDGTDFITVHSAAPVKIKSAEFLDEHGEAITAADFNKVVLPVSPQLEQNYPNPFNPETMISFDLPQSAQATVEVFNILGEKISTLVDKVLPAGRHQVIFNGRNQSDHELPSGIYFYRLRTDSFEATRKMILLK